MSERIGYVGLGNMGGALAARLQREFDVLVHDRSDAAVRRMVDAGAEACATLDELSCRCDVILLCLPTSDEVRQVIYGDGGLGTSLRPGTLIVDQTSGDPHATRSIAADLATREIQMIDAPVSGGVQGAHAGTVTIMVGASPRQYQRVLPILHVISPNVHHAGGVGDGHIVKLVNNLLSGAQRLLTFEAIALAVKNGLDAQKTIDIVLASGARNAFLEKIMAPHVVAGNLAAGFTLGLAHKDVRLACQLGADSDVPMFFGNLTREFLQMCISEMGPDAKVDTAALVMDRLAGTRVVPANPRLA